MFSENRTEFLENLVLLGIVGLVSLQVLELVRILRKMSLKQKEKS